MKPILPPKPEPGDLEACAKYAKEALKYSTKVYRVPAYIWVRFLKRSFLEGVQ